MTDLNEWNESTRAGLADTDLSLQRASISDDLSSAFSKIDSEGNPRASAATFAALLAAAAAAAVVLFVSRRAANSARVAAETVFVFI